MSTAAPRIAMVAGEPSGDLLASHLIDAIRARIPDASFVGIGGPKMMARGFDSWYPMETLSVRGYVEVLRHYREIVGIRRDIARRLLREPPDIFIGVDAPDFNLTLEHELKKKGITTMQYVSPAVWAWRAGRIRKIARSVGHLLCLFPFEPALYEGRDIEASYVGHPLADLIPLEIDRAPLREKLGIKAGAQVVALLPGSRKSELQYMADTFAQSIRLLAEANPGIVFLVPLATRETRLMFETALFTAGADQLPVRLMFGHAQDALGAADAAIVASGTATLEAALMKCPMVITYKMAPLSWQLMKRLKYQEYVGLPNILAGRFLVPELLQDRATPAALAATVEDLLSNAELRNSLIDMFSDIHRQLRQGTADKAAAAVARCLGLTSADAAVA